ncbi:unnamed protein product [Clonostachys rosea f. rosea IK726]|uniref:Uncharacterized protein n=1 Tax=Clonostachys rosea f. rosea IK726 TaxID=1349383 RepID=A0ACA9UA47_BIOOC|nr:unnamed protein product [Clonostachys rosea f. rosea IK726]
MPLCTLTSENHTNSWSARTASWLEFWRLKYLNNLVDAVGDRNRELGEVGDHFLTCLLILTAQK